MRFPSICLTLALASACGPLNPAQAQPTSSNDSCDKNELCWPRLKSGSTGSAVVGLQSLLNSRGYKLKASGSYDAKTLKAVKNYQLKHKLQVDGFVGFQTWESLTPTLRKGDKGQSVRVLQSLLWNSNHGTARDGIYGAATERQVKAFQSKQALTPTGVADQVVWSALLGGSTDSGDD